jgi:hypothetical protein
MNQTLTGANKVIANYCMQTFYSPTAGWGWRDLVGTSDVTFQTYLATAFGAKTFEYYMYRGMNSDTAIVTAIGQTPEPMYDWVTKANQEMQAFAPAILGYDWNGVKTYKGVQIADSENGSAFDLIKEKELKELKLISEVYTRLDTLVSEHFDGAGNYAYTVLNYTEPSRGQTDYVTLTFKGGAKKAVVWNAVEKVVDGQTQIQLEKSEIDVKDGQIDLVILSGRAAFVYPVYGD